MGQSLCTGSRGDLFAERSNDYWGCQVLAGAGREFGQSVGGRSLAGRGKRDGRRVAVGQVEPGWSRRGPVPARAGWVWGKQAANAVAGLVDLDGEVVVEGGAW